MAFIKGMKAATVGDVKPFEMEFTNLEAALDGRQKRFDDVSAEIAELSKEMNFETRDREEDLDLREQIVGEYNKSIEDRIAESNGDLSRLNKGFIRQKAWETLRDPRVRHLIEAKQEAETMNKLVKEIEKEHGESFVYGNDARSANLFDAEGRYTNFKDVSAQKILDHIKPMNDMLHELGKTVHQEIFFRNAGDPQYMNMSAAEKAKLANDLFLELRHAYDNNVYQIRGLMDTQAESYMRTPGGNQLYKRHLQDQLKAGYKFDDAHEIAKAQTTNMFVNYLDTKIKQEFKETGQVHNVPYYVPKEGGENPGNSNSKSKKQPGIYTLPEEIPVPIANPDLTLTRDASTAVIISDKIKEMEGVKGVEKNLHIDNRVAIVDQIESLRDITTVMNAVPHMSDQGAARRNNKYTVQRNAGGLFRFSEGAFTTDDSKGATGYNPVALQFNNISKAVKLDQLLNPNGAWQYIKDAVMEDAAVRNQYDLEDLREAGLNGYVGNALDMEMMLKKMAERELLGDPAYMYGDQQQKNAVLLQKIEQLRVSEFGGPEGDMGAGLKVELDEDTWTYSYKIDPKLEILEGVLMENMARFLKEAETDAEKAAVRLTYGAALDLVKEKLQFSRDVLKYAPQEYNSVLIQLRESKDEYEKELLQDARFMRFLEQNAQVKEAFEQKVVSRNIYVARAAMVLQDKGLTPEGIQLLLHKKTLANSKSQLAVDYRNAQRTGTAQALNHGTTSELNGSFIGGLGYGLNWAIAKWKEFDAGYITFNDTFVNALNSLYQNPIDINQRVDVKIVHDDYKMLFNLASVSGGDFKEIYIDKFINKKLKSTDAEQLLAARDTAIDNVISGKYDFRTIQNIVGLEPGSALRAAKYIAIEELKYLYEQAARGAIETLDGVNPLNLYAVAVEELTTSIHSAMIQVSDATAIKQFENSVGNQFAYAFTTHNNNSYKYNHNKAKALKNKINGNVEAAVKLNKNFTPEFKAAMGDIDFLERGYNQKTTHYRFIEGDKVAKAWTDQMINLALASVVQVTTDSEGTTKHSRDANDLRITLTHHEGKSATDEGGKLDKEVKKEDFEYLDANHPMFVEIQNAIPVDHKKTKGISTLASTLEYFLKNRETITGFTVDYDTKIIYDQEKKQYSRMPITLNISVPTASKPPNEDGSYPIGTTFKNIGLQIPIASIPQDMLLLVGIPAHEIQYSSKISGDYTENDGLGFRLNVPSNEAKGDVSTERQFMRIPQDMVIGGVKVKQGNIIMIDQPFHDLKYGVYEFVNKYPHLLNKAGGFYVYTNESESAKEYHKMYGMTANKAEINTQKLYNQFLKIEAQYPMSNGMVNPKAVQAIYALGIPNAEALAKDYQYMGGAKAWLLAVSNPYENTGEKAREEGIQIHRQQIPGTNKWLVIKDRSGTRYPSKTDNYKDARKDPADRVTSETFIEIEGSDGRFTPLNGTNVFDVPAEMILELYKDVREGTGKSVDPILADLLSLKKEDRDNFLKGGSLSDKNYQMIKLESGKLDLYPKGVRLLPENTQVFNANHAKVADGVDLVITPEAQTAFSNLFSSSLFGENHFGDKGSNSLLITSMGRGYIKNFGTYSTDLDNLTNTAHSKGTAIDISMSKDAGRDFASKIMSMAKTDLGKITSELRKMGIKILIHAINGGNEHIHMEYVGVDSSSAGVEIKYNPNALQQAAIDKGILKIDPALKGISK